MRILKKIWWFPLLVYLVIIPGLMSAKIDRTSCKKIQIDIVDSLTNKFVTRENIYNILQNDSKRILGGEIRDINSLDIEKEIDKIRELENAEVYHTIDGVLHVDADQRDPVVRIITRYGKSYYIDKNMSIIQFSKAYTPRVIVVSGYNDIPNEFISRGSASMAAPGSMLKKIVDLVQFVNDDPFWAGQVEQIWVSPEQELDIVPRVGNQLVKFGSPDNYRSKFRYLETFYRDAMPRMGWNTYREIDMRYSGQIVCTRR